ncbi:MAG: hypothetical protein J7L08_01455 [Candidatus Aenigmarchaeota archaeon]|nr:hypothetical protein [Candidatus Aenigmarchaeota archaeon]
MRLGRCMGKDEFKETKRTGELNDYGREEGVPCFECPSYIEKKLVEGKGKENREFFRKIGVRNPYGIIIFDAQEEEAKRNLRQKNGLTEYLLSQGTPIDIKYCIKN